MIKTPIRYYGGKQKILKHILPFLPDHKVYCEPFFGGGAVFFAKRPVRNEVINDRNPFVMNFYRIAQERFLDLQAKISSTLHSRHVYEQAVHMYHFPDFYGELDKAWAFWVVCHMCFLTIGDNFLYSKIKNAAAVTANKRAQFTSSIQRRLSRTTIECADALDMIRRFDSEHCFFYVDPPYMNACQGHYSGYTEAQYEQLLERLAQIQGKFLLSAYPDALLEKAAKKHKWTLRAFVMQKSASRSKNTRKVEILASNYA